MAKLRVAAYFTVPLAIWGIWFSFYHKVIDDKSTYLTVVLIGIIQALVAAASGYLAVEALPPANLERKRGPYTKVFAGLAISLFFATGIIGYLNDKSQKESKKIAADANGRIVAIQNCQKEPSCSQSYLDFLITSYAIPYRYQPSTLSNRQQQATPSDKPASPTSVTPKSDAVPPLQTELDISSTDLHVAIHQLADELNRLDANAEAKRGQLGGVITKDALAKGLSPNGPISIDFQPQFQDIDDEQTMTYVKEVLPKILDIRAHALKHVSASFLVDDERNFQTANGLAMLPTGAPKTGSELWNSRHLRDARMSGYFINLSSEANQNFPRNE
jgi:hypothetical protein